MRHLAYAFALVGSLAMGGCGGSGFLDALSSPKTTQAIANVKGLTQAFACGLSSAAAAAQGVESYQYNGKPLVNDQGQQITAIVYASSTTTCQLLGGVVTSAAPVAVTPATTVVATTKAS